MKKFVRIYNKLNMDKNQQNNYVIAKKLYFILIIMDFTKLFINIQGNLKNGKYSQNGIL